MDADGDSIDNFYEQFNALADAYLSQKVSA
jgi:hypothetical protein